MTRRWHIDDAPTTLQLKEIADALTGGAVVLMPTDTIYGLHAVASNAGAVARIAELKGRDEQQKPFIVLASSVEQLPELGITADPELLATLASLWPAPLTAILPRERWRTDNPASPASPSTTEGQAGLPVLHRAATLAVRIPDVEWLRALVTRTGPLVSTSANRSGEPAVDRPSALARDLQNAIEIVDGGIRGGEPSAILDLTSDEPRFIRERDRFFTQKVWKTLRKSL